MYADISQIVLIGILYSILFKQAIGENETIYKYEENLLVNEIRNGYTIDYFYTDEGMLAGLKYDNKTFFYIKDEDGSIIEITDENKNPVAKYEYDENGIANVLGLNSNLKWEDIQSSDFIGNVNLIRYLSYYYDEETSYYYGNGRIYNPVSKIFIDNKPIQEITRNTVTYYDPTEPGRLYGQIENWCNSLLSSSDYGTPKSAVDGWYASLSDVEILARLIYGENTLNVIDQKAVSWVLLNRLYAGMNGSSLRAIATQAYQFSTIYGTGSYNARNPVTTSERWKSATWLACAISTTTVSEYCEALYGRPQGITNQRNFRALSSFVCSDLTGSELYILFNGNRIKNVVVVGKIYLGYSEVVDANRKAQLDAVSNKTYHNVFFSYYSEY